MYLYMLSLSLNTKLKLIISPLIIDAFMMLLLVLLNGDGVDGNGSDGDRCYPIDGDGVDGTGSDGDRCYPIYGWDEVDGTGSAGDRCYPIDGWADADGVATTGPIDDGDVLQNARCLQNVSNVKKQKVIQQQWSSHKNRLLYIVIQPI